MSPDAKITRFTPAAIASQRTDTDDPSRAAGFAAGWAAGARAAAEAAQADRARQQADHDQRESQRDLLVQQALMTLAAATQSWHQRAVPVIDEARAAVYAAALELAEAILQREIQPGPQSARTLLERALQVPADADPTNIRLHPDDLLHVNLLIESGEVKVPEGLRLVADARLSHGDAITEHDDGALDARISTAVARARAALLGGE